MKKKLVYILIVFGGIFLIFAFYTHLIDSARVRNGVEPKFTIKLVNEDNNKITYIGLGYKVVRYVSESISEPYENNRGVKYGSWFMNYKLTDDYRILEIVDKTKDKKDFMCAEALEEFYRNDDYVYFYSCIKSSYVIVKFENGIEMTVKDALKNEYITIKDLDEYKIDYYKSANGLTNTYINDYRLELNINDNIDKANNYYTRNGITVYLVGLNDISLIRENSVMSLKYHFENVNQTFDKSIDDIIGLLELKDTLKDGGTKIYKNNDITLIKCNTIDGNKDIYIGDDTLGYKQEYCK